MLHELDRNSIRGEVGWSTLSYFLAFCPLPTLPTLPLPGEPSALAFNGSEVAWVRLCIIS